MLKGHFNLEKDTSLRTEVLAGFTTLATMAYIIFVQPVVLGAAGMDAGAVFTSTCLVTAFATILMALLANYPVAVAPAMGHNFFFASMVVLTLKVLMVVTPLTFSITDGIAFGFISYALLKLVTGRAKEAHWLIYVFAGLFIVRYAVSGLH